MTFLFAWGAVGVSLFLTALITEWLDDKRKGHY